MVFNSGEFLLFFPIVVLIYYLLPDKVKHFWLLFASYYFYMSWNAKYALLLLFSTVVTFLSGLVIEKSLSEKGRKIAVAFSFMLNLAVLFFYKYINFSIMIINTLIKIIGINVNISNFDILLPVGISFFTFQALSYTMDVYRGDVYPEHDFFRYALYVSFFPQLVAGPIERSKDLLKQLAVPSAFDYKKVKDGIFIMLWGFFLKIVLADRIALVVDTVYNRPYDYEGWYFIVATVLFAVQIYCDFAGYSTIAVGAAEILGIELMDNFNSPYLAQSVSDFWRNWHISLTSWFRDYLYIPLGGSRKGQIRKDVNRIIVFLISGLWHGAGMHFVIWGGINGIYQVIGERLMPIRKKYWQILNLNTSTYGFKISRVVCTFVLIDLSWIFFRAANLREAVFVLKSIIHAGNHWILFDGALFELGLDEKEFMVMLVGIMILGLVDIAKHFGVCVRKEVLKQDYPVRLLVFIVSVISILTFGIWGPGYNASNFIYFQF